MSNATIICLQHAPPSLNNIYANLPGKGRVKSNHYRIWRSAAGWDVKAAKVKLISGPVLLDITVEKPRGVRSDVSNRIKATEDLLVEMGVLADDSLVMEVRARWGDVKGARIEIMPLDAPVKSKKPARSPLLTGAMA